MHCPPFLQGLCLHSLTSEEGGRFLWFKCFIHFCINCGVFGTKQRSGSRVFKPAVTLCLRRTQRLAGNHSLWSQSWPSHPSGQTHWNEFTLSTQVPPFLHGLPMQSLISKIKRKWYDLYNDILKGLKEKKNTPKMNYRPQSTSRIWKLKFLRTLVTVDATETRITDAGEVSGWLADAASSCATDIGGYVLYAIRVIGCNSNDAAVNSCQK